MTLTVEAASGAWPIPTQRAGSALPRSDDAIVAPDVAVRCSLLGPLRILVDGAEVRLNGAKERTVLAALLLYADHVLDDHRLMQLLWDFDPSATSNAQIHSYVWRLRRKLGASVPIERQSC